jgi:RimJ/RimL family protein N-acetyltransferase
MKKAVHCTVNVPILETERLRLRGHRLDDFPASAAMWADPVVTRHTTGKPQTREEVWLRLLRVTLTNLAASSMM